MSLGGLDCAVRWVVGVRRVYGEGSFSLCTLYVFVHACVCADTSFYILLTLIDRQLGQMSSISRVQPTPNTSDMTDLPACRPGWLLGEASEGGRERKRKKASSRDILCFLVW